MYIFSIIIATTIAIVVVEVPDYKYVEKCDIVTDIWIRETLRIFGSKQEYVFELNNNDTIVVNDFDYHNYGINDTYCHQIKVKNGDGVKKIWE